MCTGPLLSDYSIGNTPPSAPVDMKISFFHTPPPLPSTQYLNARLGPRVWNPRLCPELCEREHLQLYNKASEI